MRVFASEKGLAVLLPAALVESLALKAGDEIDVSVVRSLGPTAEPRPSHEAQIRGLRKYRGRLPADFRWNRLDAAE